MYSALCDLGSDSLLYYRIVVGFKILQDAQQTSFDDYYHNDSEPKIYEFTMTVRVHLGTQIERLGGKCYKILRVI